MSFSSGGRDVLKATYVLDARVSGLSAATQADRKFRESIRQTDTALRGSAAMRTQEGNRMAQAATRASETTARAARAEAAAWEHASRIASQASRRTFEAQTQAVAHVSSSVSAIVREKRKEGQAYTSILDDLRRYRVSSQEAAAAVEHSASKEVAAIDRVRAAQDRLRKMVGATPRGGAGQLAGSEARSAERGALGAAYSRVRVGASSLGGGLVGGIAAYAGISGIKSAVDETTSLARAVQYFTSVTGMSVKEGTQWVAVAKAYGVQSNQLAVAFRTMSKQAETALHSAASAATGSSKEATAAMDRVAKKADQALHGSKSAAKGFVELGISYSDLKSHAGSLHGTYDLVVQKLAQMKDGTHKTALEQEFLGKAMSGAQIKSKAAQGAFAQLGISQDQLKKHSHDMSGLMDLVVGKLEKMRGGTQKTAIEAALFGRSASRLSPILNAGAKALEEQRKQASALGVTLGGNAAANAHKLEEAQVKLRLAQMAFQVQLTEHLFPALMKFMDLGLKLWAIVREKMGPVFHWLGGEIHDVSRFFKEHEGVANALKVALAGLVASFVAMKVIGTVSKLARGLTNDFRGAVAMVKALGSPLKTVKGLFAEQAPAEEALAKANTELAASNDRLAASYDAIAGSAKAAAGSEAMAKEAGGLPAMGGVPAQFGGSAARSAERAAVTTTEVAATETGVAAAGAEAGMGAMAGAAGIAILAGMMAAQPVADWAAKNSPFLTSSADALGQIQSKIQGAQRTGDVSRLNALGQAAGEMATKLKTLDPSAVPKFNALGQAAQQAAKAIVGQRLGAATSSMSGARTEAQVLQGVTPQLSKLPAQFRNAGALSVVQLARGMEEKRQLPRGATDQLIRDLESKYPGLARYLQQQGANSMRALSDQFRVNRVQSNAIGLINQIHKTFSFLPTYAQTAGANTQQKMATAMASLQDIIKHGTAAQRAAAIPELRKLVSEYGSYLDALGQRTKDRLGTAGRRWFDFGNTVLGIYPQLITVQNALNAVYSIANGVNLKPAEDAWGGFSASLQRLFPVLAGLQSALQAIQTLAVTSAIGPGTRSGSITGHQRGGYVVPGPAYKDGTLALLAGDEVVLTGDGQRQMHAQAPGLLHEVVREQLPHFATGGFPQLAPSSRSSSHRRSSSHGRSSSRAPAAPKTNTYINPFTKQVETLTAQQYHNLSIQYRVWKIAHPTLIPLGKGLESGFDLGYQYGLDPSQSGVVDALKALEQAIQGSQLKAVQKASSSTTTTSAPTPMPTATGTSGVSTPTGYRTGGYVRGGHSRAPHGHLPRPGSLHTTTTGRPVAASPLPSGGDWALNELAPYSGESFMQILSEIAPTAEAGIGLVVHGHVRAARKAIHQAAQGLAGVRTGGSNTAIQQAFTQLNGAITNTTAYSFGHLQGLASHIERQIKNLQRVGKPSADQQHELTRLQNALQLVQYQEGQRVGTLVRGAENQAAALQGAQTRLQRLMDRQGIEATSAQGASMLEAFSKQAQATLQATVTSLRKAYVLAVKAGDSKAAADVQSKLKDALDQLDQATTDAVMAHRAAIEAAAQGISDAAAHATNLAQAGLQGVQLRQQLAGTAGTPGGARQIASYIQQSIIPSLNAELQGLAGQYAAAKAVGDETLANQIAEAMAAKQNDVLQEQLDAQNAIKDATQQLAQNTSGTLGVSYQSQNLPDLAGMLNGA